MSNFLANLRLVLFVVLVILFIVFLLQNTGDTPIKFLVYDGRISTVVLVLVTTLSGFLAGYFMGSTSLRRRKKAAVKQETGEEITKALNE